MVTMITSALVQEIRIAGVTYSPIKADDQFAEWEISDQHEQAFEKVQFFVVDKQNG